MPSLHWLVFSTLMVLLTDLAALIDCWQPQKQLKRQSVSYQSPNTESEESLYHHRAFHSSIVVGEYLYIHGGEITTWNGSGSGIYSEPNVSHAFGNVTTVPGNSSWTNKTVALIATDSEAPTLMSQALWNDRSDSSFYAYDGGLSYAIALGTPPPNQLWQFKPSGSSGAWSQVNQPASSNFTDLKRVQASMYASGGGLGFAMGGFQQVAETYTFKDRLNTPGMAIYNFTSMQWLNVSTTGYSFNGIAMEGAGLFVPSFGQAGLFFVLGGLVGPVGEYTDGTLPSLDTIFMFDPSSQQWSSQQTSGTAPVPILDPCVVGAQSDNDTYEVRVNLLMPFTDDAYMTCSRFSCGGGVAGQTPNDTVNNAVFVLSLPAFHWLQSEYTPTLGRTRQTCNIIGNRQMVSVGGITGQPGSLTPDPWDQGLGIFDMSAMKWKDRYDPDAEAYVSPDSVKAYYQQNGTYPESWSNEIVKAWFTKAVANSTSSAPANPGAPPALPTGSPGIKKGTLAGITIGGVAALTLIVLLVLYLLQRRRRGATAAAQPSSPGNGYQKPELENNNKKLPSELPGVKGATEMMQREVATSELPSWRERHELAGESWRGGRTN